MSYAATQVQSRDVNPTISTAIASAKWKTYGFAIALILGLGGLAVGATGLVFFLQGNLKQLHAIVMMAAGGGMGIPLFIFGIVGSLKNRQVSTTETKPLENSKPIDKPSDLVYGPEAWKRLLNVEVVGVSAKPPQVDLSKEDQLLLFVPEKIRINGKERYLTLELIEQIAKERGIKVQFSDTVNERFGSSTISSAWVQVSRHLIEGSLGKLVGDHQELLIDKNCESPKILEAFVLHLMFKLSTGKKLYGENFTRCSDLVKYGYGAVGFDEESLTVEEILYARDDLGVAFAKRTFI